MSEAGGRRPDRAVIAIGIALLGLAGLVVYESVGLRASFGNQAIGPQMAPFLVGGLLALFGALTALEGLRGAAPPRDAEDWTAVVWIAGGLAVAIALTRTAGFVPAMAAIFAATAHAFGSRRALVDLAIGAVFGLAIYLFFSRVLGLTLPSGFAETFL